MKVTVVGCGNAFSTINYNQSFFGGKDFFGNLCDWEDKATADGFAGFVKVGQTFDF
jgi:hypothetical protein